MTKKKKVIPSWLEIAFWIVLILMVPAYQFGSSSPLNAMGTGVLYVVVGVIGLFGALAMIGLRRVRSGLLLVSGLIIAGAGTSEWMVSTKLERLQETDQVEYLAYLRETRGEEKWLSELERLAPEEYLRERNRIDAEIAEASRLRVEQRALEEQQRQARRAEEQQRAQQDYLQMLRANIADLEDPEEFVFNSPEDLAYFLDFVDGMGEFVWRGRQFQLSGEALAELNRMERALSELQTTYFPQARDAYGPIQRNANWRNFFSREINMRTEGAGFRTIKFVGNYYAFQANQLEDYEAILPDLRKMRFGAAVFVTELTSQGAQFNIVSAPEDGDVGYWHTIANGQSFFRKASSD